MIERQVFVKLKPEFASDAARAEVRARSLELRDVPGVRSVTVGMPADDDALRAWDLSLTVRFDSLDEVDAYLDHPGHEAYYEGFLLERLQVIKAWNFEV
jgi:Stress responsive A/B Barrel Domain